MRVQRFQNTSFRERLKKITKPFYKNLDILILAVSVVAIVFPEPEAESVRSNDCH